MSTIRNLNNNHSKLSSNLSKLASGRSINKAADNPAGLAISEKMKADITQMNKGITNNYDSINYSNTMDGKLSGVHSVLDRMNELAAQAANGTYTNDERSALQAEFSELNTSLMDSGMNVGSFNISTQDGAQNAANGLIGVINTVSSERGVLGAQTNRLEHQNVVSEITSENLQASESKIADADMAKEMMAFTKNNILSQASISMALHEKQNASQVLTLLK